MRHKLDHVHAVRARLADGTVTTYYYHRRTRKPIHGIPGTPEFLASYVEAGKIERPIGNQTLGDLIQRYRQSHGFGKLAQETRRVYDRHLAHLDEIWGTMPLDVVGDRSFRKGIKDERDRIAERSERGADYFVAVLSIVLGYAVDDGTLEENHAKAIRKLYKPDRANKIWADQDIAAFQAVASPELQLALRLALDTGQRQKDLLRLPWSAFDGATISLRQSKTDAEVTVPCTTELRAALETAPRRSPLILTNSRGRPWTSDGFRTSWHKATKASGITGLTFHDLRGTAVTRLAEAGCTVPEIASITGHTLRSATTILRAYRARTSKQASAAIEKLNEHRRKRTS
jgi:integrase